MKSMTLLKALSVAEKMNLTNIYCCVLVKGQNTDGVPVYCYFGVFLDTVEAIRNHIKSGLPFNPKDYKAIVLARSTGEPSPEIREFMRMKFSFAEDEVVFELAKR